MVTADLPSREISSNRSKPDMKSLAIDAGNRSPLLGDLMRASRLRRRLLVAWIGLGCFLPTSGAQANVIEDENLQAGTTAWQLTNPADNRQIEGYASLTSVLAGGDINLFVNTRDTTYSLTVYRIGW